MDDDAKKRILDTVRKNTLSGKNNFNSHNSSKTSNLTFTITLPTLVMAVLMALMVLPPTLSSSSSTSMADLNQTQAIEADKKDPILLMSILANELETRINKSGAILEITSKLPQVKSAPHANLISSELHGIPQDVDIPKRKVAQHILDTDKDFQVIFFLMPNGDVYLVEPYSQQQNLTGNNFAFRDYYKGAIESRNTYLSDVIISAALGRPQANIAVPMYPENNGTLVGLWAGGLNLTSLSESLQSLNLTNNDIDDERIVIVDQQGQKIVDSRGQSLLLGPNSTVNESFADLQSFSNAINGQSGTITEIINGIMTAVSYHPVKAFSNLWTVLFMQPYDDNDDTVSDKTIIMQKDLISVDDQEEELFMVKDID